MDNEATAAGTDKQDWFLRQAARLVLPSVSVSLHHNLTSKTSWIHCRFLSPCPCDALFQSLDRLLHHERVVHRKKALSFGSYKIIRLRAPQVKLDRREVEDWLQEQRQRRNNEKGQRILRRRKRQSKQRHDCNKIQIPNTNAADAESLNLDTDPDFVLELDQEDNKDDDDDGDDEFNPKLASSSSKWSLPFKCGKCKTQFVQLGALRRHRMKKQCSRSLPHACPCCKRHFRHCSSMKAHVRLHHPNENVPQAGAKSLQRSEVKYNCSKCDRTFPKPHQLVMHEVRHHGGDKSFVCTYAPEECTKRFWTKGALKTHVDNIHKRVGWFHCDRCLKVYQTDEKLLAHSRVCLMRMFEAKVDEPRAGLPGSVLATIEAGGTCTPGETGDTEGDGGLEEPEEDPLALTTTTEPAPGPPQVETQPEKPEETPSTSNSTPSPNEEVVILAVEVEDSKPLIEVDLVDVGGALDVDIKDEGTLRQNQKRQRTATNTNTSTSADVGVQDDGVKSELLEPGEIRVPNTFDLGTYTNTAADVQASPTESRPRRRPRKNKKNADDLSGLLIVMPPKRSGCLTCPACGKVFAKRDHLYAHVDRHNKSLQGKLPCDFPGCGKLLTSERNLELHRVTHTLETPFKCSYCGLGFKTCHGRKFHERREHIREFPFKCHFPPCERSFVAKQQLQVHELRAHTREKNHACAHCDQKFLLKRQLVQHERSHTGEKPLLCAYCGRGFARYNQRSNHQKRHEAMIEKMRAKGMKDAETATKEKVAREQANSKAQAEEAQALKSEFLAVAATTATVMEAVALAGEVEN